MAAALVDARVLQDDSVWQLAFWPPDRVVPLTLRKVRAVRVVVRPVIVHAPAPVVLEAPAGTFPCTWPQCDRGASNPFPSARQLANHRFAAHGIRSSNEESIARQQRRDRKRQLAKGTPPPEYIDVTHIRAAVQQFLPLNLGSHIRTGPLDPGECERLRRRLCYYVTHDLMRELLRTPAEIIVAIAQLAARGLVPPRLFDDAKTSERTIERLLTLLEDRDAAGEIPA